MKLESLPNELLLSIFRRLSTAHLFRAFKGLNSRFDALLSVHFESVGRIDFRSMSKTNFNILCQDYLPFFINNIKTIHISDEDECPQSIDLFCSFGFTFSQFINLQKLSMFHINDKIKINQIICECYYLRHLKTINIIDCHFHYNFNEIWSLSNLTHCNVKNNTLESNFKFSFGKTSTSIEHLSIKNKTLGLGDMICLFEHTPNLRYLEIDVHNYFIYHEFTNVISTITILKMSIRSSFDVLNLILENMPNLIDLKIETKNLYVSGYQWEQLVKNYLTKLELFQLKMQFQFSENEDKMKQMDEIIDTFRSSFWLDERYWFVQLDDSAYDAILYTLPYAFDHFVISKSTVSKTTYPSDDKHWLYDQVYHLNCFSIAKSFPTDQIQFPNVRQLDMDFSFYDYLWFISPIVNRLTSIVIKFPQNDSFRNPLIELENIINDAIHLYSLTFLNYPETYHFPLNVTHSSIRRLDYKQCSRHFNRSECIAFSHSLIGIQCEVLFINIICRKDIMEFVKSMINLRMLYVRYLYEMNSEADRLSLIDNDLVQSLKEELPSTRTINTNANNTNSIQLWIQ